MTWLFLLHFLYTIFFSFVPCVDRTAILFFGFKTCYMLVLAAANVWSHLLLLCTWRISSAQTAPCNNHNNVLSH